MYQKSDLIQMQRTEAHFIPELNLIVKGQCQRFITNWLKLKYVKVFSLFAFVSLLRLSANDFLAS